MKKLIPLTILILLIMITQTGCGTEEPVSDSGFYLNTTCEITVYGMSKSQAQEEIDKAFSLIDEYEKTKLSRTSGGSDVYKINHAGGRPVQVSGETIEVINLGLELCKATGGRFDITLGRVSELWDFTGDNPHVPADAELAKALKPAGYENVKVSGSTVSVPEGVYLDLGAVAKGYIADRAAEQLEADGVTSAIVNLGGNVVAIGAKNGDSDWRIGIERPYSDRTEIIGAVSVQDSTVVTSGIYERKFEEKGRLYHHVLDPETGYPVDTDLEAVTVVADKGNSGFCDGLTTSCMLLGLDEGREFIAEMQAEYPDKNIRASFIDRQDNIYSSEGMEIEAVD